MAASFGSLERWVYVGAGLSPTSVPPPPLPPTYGERLSVEYPPSLCKSLRASPPKDRTAGRYDRTGHQGQRSMQGLTPGGAPQPHARWQAPGWRRSPSTSQRAPRLLKGAGRAEGPPQGVTVLRGPLVQDEGKAARAGAGPQGRGDMVSATRPPQHLPDPPTPPCPPKPP